MASLPLPDPLPESPLSLLAEWLAEARQASRSAMSMAVATVDPDGRPSARMLICRGFDDKAGWLVFYTDRDSRKGRALERFPRAAVVFHWDALERQVRVEGPVTAAPEEDSDRYWNTRPVDARIAAIASDQTRPIASRRALLAKVEQAAREHGPAPARPARWGGYRVWAETVELWVGQPARIHDRAAWVRRLEKAGDEFTGHVWEGTRLQP
jgi:pyridoxamine 5'-phosphate oxidase